MLTALLSIQEGMNPEMVAFVWQVARLVVARGATFQVCGAFEFPSLPKIDG